MKTKKPKKLDAEIARRLNEIRMPKPANFQQATDLVVHFGFEKNVLVVYRYKDAAGQWQSTWCVAGGELAFQKVLEDLRQAANEP